MEIKKVAIVMGSDSDLPIIQKATDTLKGLSIPFEVHIYSAHRTPVEARDFAVNARENGFGALICAAGMAAHLAGRRHGAAVCRPDLPVHQEQQEGRAGLWYHQRRGFCCHHGIFVDRRADGMTKIILTLKNHTKENVVKNLVFK